MHIVERGTTAAVGALTLIGLGFAAAASPEPQTAPPSADKIPITASSEPERLIVQGLDAGAKGEVARQQECYTKLTASYPKDARGFNLLGGFYFGQQDYPAAIAAYTRATALDPGFSQPYNQLG